ncbi:MAG: oligosaccharide flippase family protein [Planctomycetota bacterium]
MDDLHGKAASGLVTNLLFSCAGGLVTLLQIVLVPRLLGPELIGLFGLASAFGMAFEAFSDFGVGDKLVQDKTDDLRASYQTAFTVSLLLSSGLWFLLVLAAPLIARYYGLPVLWPLLTVMSYRAFTSLVRLPLNVHYRRLNFAAYRLFPFLGKCCSLAVTVVLIYGGWGVWSLALGELAGLLLTAIPVWIRSPIPAKLRYEPAVARKYLVFSWPIWSAKMTGALIGPATVVAISLYLNMTTLGHYKLAEQLAIFGLSIDLILAQTAFPFFCRLQDSGKRLEEAFIAMSRLTMVWATPVGFGMFVFASDFISFVLTPEWAGAAWFIRVQGLAVVGSSLAYSWDTLLKAMGVTRPILSLTAVFASSCALVFFPLVMYFGYQGILWGLVIVTALGIAGRQYYLSKYFAGISVLRIAPKEIGAGVAVSGLMLLWWRFSAPASLMDFLARAALFVAGFLAVVAVLERRTIASYWQRARGR